MSGSTGSGHDQRPDRFADDPAFAVHEGGKLSVTPTRSIDSIADLALTYTPGVARVSSAIAAEPELAHRFTWAPRVVAVVSDGTAVLGLGNIGPVASLPVMEGKACLFSEFAGLDAVPIVLSSTDVDTIVETVAAIAPSFGGINLEDISAPRCFEIEARLRERLSIPVMHDDQHGTAIVVLARFPARPELLTVKRVRRAVPGGHWVEGDNPFVTDDSRAYGPAVVVGRVVGRVWPRPGRLPPPPPD